MTARRPLLPRLRRFALALAAPLALGVMGLGAAFSVATHQNAVVQTIPKFAAAITHTAVSDDGNYAAFASADGALQIWRTNGAREPAVRVPNRNGPVTGLFFDTAVRGGQTRARLIYATALGHVHGIDAETGARLLPEDAFPESVTPALIARTTSGVIAMAGTNGAGRQITAILRPSADKAIDLQWPDIEGLDARGRPVRLLPFASEADGGRFLLLTEDGKAFAVDVLRRKNEESIEESIYVSFALTGVPSPASAQLHSSADNSFTTIVIAGREGRAFPTAILPGSPLGEEWTTLGGGKCAGDAIVAPAGSATLPPYPLNTPSSPRLARGFGPAIVTQSGRFCYFDGGAWRSDQQLPEAISNTAMFDNWRDLVAVGGANGVVRLLNSNQRRLPLLMRGHGAAITSMTTRNDVLAVGAADGSAQIVDVVNAASASVYARPAAGIDNVVTDLGKRWTGLLDILAPLPKVEIEEAPPPPAEPTDAISVEKLQQLMPDLAPEILSQIAIAANAELQKSDINTPLRLAHFWAQMAHEGVLYPKARDGRITSLTESERQGASYEGRTNLGNTQRGDGVRYRARGLIGVTGRRNYNSYSRIVGVDLEANPNFAADPDIAMQIAIAYWSDVRANGPADADDIDTVTRRLTNAQVGIENRRRLLTLAKELWPANAPLRFSPPQEMPPIRPAVMEADFYKISPNARRDIVTAMTVAFNKHLPRYGMTTPLRISHFMSQAARESSDFRTLIEQGSEASFAKYDGDQRLGNTQPGDGARYRGRGVIQLTGRSNYRAYGALLNLDLEGNPELAANPDIAAQVFLTYWCQRKINDVADKDDVNAVTRRINGGLNGLEDRRQKLRIAKSIWTNARLAFEPVTGPAPRCNLDAVPAQQSATPSPEAAAPAIVTRGALDVTFSVTAQGVVAGEFTYKLQLNGETYQIEAQRRSTGIARTLLSAAQDYRYSVSGAIVDGQLRPASYEHQGGRNNRTVTVAFSPNDVVTAAKPEMGMGNPPATREQKLNTVDQLTAIASMAIAGNSPCGRTIRVFMDGRARFDFVMGQQINYRSSKGEAIRCLVQFAPIAGFSDPQTPAAMSFIFERQPNGMFAPTRIEMPTDEGPIILNARSVKAQ